MEEEKIYDLVVVGGGGAGFCAAMRAAQLGKSVALLEKAPSVGGSAAMARGVGAVGARDQLKDPKGNFSVAEMLQDWMNQTNFLANYPLVHTYLSHSGETVDWLQDLGCRLEYVGSVQERHFNSRFQTYFIWDTYKAGEMRRLIRRIEKCGGKIFIRTAATNLLTDKGRVTGVTAQSGDTHFSVRGRAVILCSGGYGSNPEMVARATRGVRVNAINTGCQTGDGIRLGTAVGGDTENLDAMEFHGCDSPCDKVSRASIGGHGNDLSKLCQFPATLWVNRNGYRFCNEEVGGDISFVGNVTFRQGDVYFVALDRRMVDLLSTKGAGALGVSGDVRGILPDEAWSQLSKQIDAGIRCGIVHRGNTLAEAAAAAGIAETPFVRTVDTYNRCCTAGQDFVYGKKSALLRPLTQPPFYLSEGRANQLCSLGGLRIDTEMHVLTPNLCPIPGLFAAGCDASGGLVNNAYVSYEGVTMGWACTSGKLAGEYACAETGSPGRDIPDNTKGE